MNTYKTSEIANMIGIHPNTVRLYEEWGMIPKPKRLPNGYRIYTDFHIEQFKLARLALHIEVLQNGLRKRIIQMVKISAKGDFDMALSLTHTYIKELNSESENAKEAVLIVKQILSSTSEENIYLLRRKEVSEFLNISMDTLRNWEMNGLLTVKRKENGYRVYTDDDICRLRIIRSLRCANYSLEAILQMLSKLSQNPNVDILTALNTPDPDTDIIAVCDKLVTSLSVAESNALKIINMLENMKLKFI